MRVRLGRGLVVLLCCWVAVAWCDAQQSSGSLGFLPMAQAAGGKKGADKTVSVPAKGAIDRGLAAFEAKDWSTATRLFSEAFRLSPRPELLYHLARVAAAEGQAVVAYDLFRRYLADPAREPDDAATQTAEAAVATPPPNSGSVAIQSDPGALVLVDDRVAGTLPLPLPLLLPPGPHTIVLEFANKKFEAPVQVQAARVTELRVSRASGAVLLSVLPAIVVVAQPPLLPPDVTRRLAESIEQAARAEQFTTLGLELLLPQANERERCLANARCLTDLARTSKVDWLLQQRIVVSGDPRSPTWQVTLRLVHIDIAEPAAESDLAVAADKLDGAVSSLRQSYSKLLGKGLTRPRGTLRIDVNPASAAVQLDLRPSQAVSASQAVSLWAGRYPLSASASGFKPQQVSADIQEGQTTELRIQLEPLAGAGALPDSTAQPTARLPRPTWRLALGGAMLAAGLGLISVGAAGLAVDGSCVEEPVAPARACPTIRSTAAVGGFSLGSGIVLVGSGVLLFALPGPRPHAATKQP